MNAVWWEDFKEIHTIGESTANDEIRDNRNKNKFIQDDQLFILRDGKIYTVDGLEVR